MFLHINNNFFSSNMTGTHLVHLNLSDIFVSFLHIIKGFFSYLDIFQQFSPITKSCNIPKLSLMPYTKTAGSVIERI